MDSHKPNFDTAALCGMVKAAREDVGMPLDELSALTGIWMTGLRRMEAGDPRTTISTIESCIVALEAKGVRFRYAGEVTKPSYEVPGRKVRRPVPPPKRKRQPAFLPPGWAGQVRRTSWGYSISREG